MIAVLGSTIVVLSCLCKTVALLGSKSVHFGGTEEMVVGDEKAYRRENLIIRKSRSELEKGLCRPAEKSAADRNK